MKEESNPAVRCTAFHGSERFATGEVPQVAMAVKALLDREPGASVLIFNDATSHFVEIDFLGTPEEVWARLMPAPMPAGPGRPKLGVVAREVTLLPRHWDWLNRQPGGASVALRKLVEEARKANEGADRVREAQEASDRFMRVMGGDRAGFEEASRALYAGQRDRFETEIASWPADVRDHLRKLAEPAFVESILA